MTYKVKYCPDMDPHLISNDVRPLDSRIKKLNEENQFFIKLEQSILKEGFRNPIIINARINGITCTYGGSRLIFAQKHNLKIPCIISDFDNIFPDAKLLHTPGEVKKYFLDIKNVWFKPNGVRASVLHHYHLGEKDG